MKRLIILGVVLFVICIIGLISFGVIFLVLKLIGVKINLSKLWERKDDAVHLFNKYKHHLK